MSRTQLALNVDDLDASIAFYSALFATAPAMVRPGCANFAVVEVADTGSVEAAGSRLRAAGLDTLGEREDTCCYAVQDKLWVEPGPDGERWEVYTVLADSPTWSATSADAVEQACCR